jgi:predicted transport protein
MLIPDRDDKRIGRKVPDSYRWTLNYQVVIKSLEDIDDVMGLIEKSYYKTQ